MKVIRMIRRWARWPGMAMAGMMLAGCGFMARKHELPQPPPMRPATPSADTTGMRRVHDLGRGAVQLTDDSKQLPGANAAQHSRIMQQVFADLLQSLPLLGNPSADRVFAQRLSIIQGSRSQLASGSGDLAIEPAIDTGLRAASAVLLEISHDEHYAQADLGPLLDKLSAEINRLDVERNSDLHRIDVAETVDAISQIVSKFAAALTGEPAAGPTGSTSRPATAPADAPAK